jgi:hypothetical protein
MVLMAEAHTPYVAPLLRDEYNGFRELLRLRKEQKVNEAQFEQKRLDTTFVIQSMLFGDGAVALLVGAEEGKPSFGPISHLTNEETADVDLLTMNSNSSHPFLKGRPQYFMEDLSEGSWLLRGIEELRKPLERLDRVYAG